MYYPIVILEQRRYPFSSEVFYLPPVKSYVQALRQARAWLNRRKLAWPCHVNAYSPTLTRRLEKVGTIKPIKKYGKTQIAAK